jgi:hypothetical protein
VGGAAKTTGSSGDGEKHRWIAMSQFGGARIKAGVLTQKRGGTRVHEGKKKQAGESLLTRRREGAKGGF